MEGAAEKRQQKKKKHLEAKSGVYVAKKKPTKKKAGKQ